MQAMDRLMKNNLVLLFFMFSISTCGGGGNSTGEHGSGVPLDEIRIEGRYLVSSQSDLVLEIPSDLQSSATDSGLKIIYSDASANFACQSPDASVLDLLLVETCLKYHEFYLFPDNLPASLSGLEKAVDYVDYLRSYDPHTFYYTFDQYIEQVAPVLRGETAKIGIKLAFNEEAGTVEITYVAPFSKGWRDGFLAGDLILAVYDFDNGFWIDVQGFSVEKLQDLLPTTEDEEGLIRVERAALEAPVEISTSSEMAWSMVLDDAAGVGYVSLRKFTKTTMEDVKHEIDKLTDEMQGPPNRLILDLRGNGGGSVEGALNLTDYLIDNDGSGNPIMFFDGTILHDEGRYLGQQRPGQNLEGFSKETFVVLVNEATASASEILIEALMHYQTATVVGTTTYGKGVRQDVKELVNGDRLFITSHFNLGPDHESYHGVGIEPDKFVASEAELLSFDYDPQLDAAIYWATTLDWAGSYAGQ